MALLEELKPRAKTFPADYSCAELLRALARAKAPLAEEVIRDAATWGVDRVQTAAAEALGLLVGVSNPFAFVCNRLNEVHFVGLTGPQRAYYCVAMLQAEVNNGGFAQYFFNPFGNHARDALKALEELGATATADLLREAMSRFGKQGPSPDRDLRHEELSQVATKRDHPFSELDSTFFKNDDKLDVLLAGFAAQHAEHFREQG
jgi:hypothetical protein